jgi:TonB family protein
MHFTDSMPSGGEPSRASERRGNSRHAPNSLSYVHLDETNGGILINLSEGGLAVQAAMSVMEDELSRVRLQMPLSTTWLEASARVVWTSDSRRTLGIQFVNLMDSDRAQLREWLASEAKTGEPSSAVVLPPSESPLQIPIEDEIPIKTIRSARPRTQNAQAKDFDLAALLSSAEAARAALPKSVQRAAESASPIPVVPKTVPVARQEEKKNSSSRSGYALLVVILAILSSAAGWEAGRGDVFQTIEALFLPSSVAPKSSAVRSAPQRTPSVSAPANFEVVDANNQAWLVPFAGATSAAGGGPALPSVPAKNLAAQDQGSTNSSRTYQLWTLAAPQSAHSSAVQTGAAPVLPSSSQNSSVPSTLGPTDPNFNLLPPSQEPERSSTLSSPQVIHRVDPLYPTEAYRERISGTVKLEATITESGTVTNAKAISGPPILIPAAMTALRQWRYKPEMLDGHAVNSDIVVTIQFDLPR